MLICVSIQSGEIVESEIVGREIVESEIVESEIIESEIVERKIVESESLEMFSLSQRHLCHSCHLNPTQANTFAAVNYFFLLDPKIALRFWFYMSNPSICFPPDKD